MYLHDQHLPKTQMPQVEHWFSGKTIFPDEAMMMGTARAPDENWNEDRKNQIKRCSKWVDRM
jgi:hypothetical protein